MTPVISCDVLAVAWLIFLHDTQQTDSCTLGWTVLCEATTGRDDGRHYRAKVRFPACGTPWFLPLHCHRYFPGFAGFFMLRFQKWSKAKYQVKLRFLVNCARFSSGWLSPWRWTPRRALWGWPPPPRPAHEFRKSQSREWNGTGNGDEWCVRGFMTTIFQDLPVQFDSILCCRLFKDCCHITCVLVVIVVGCVPFCTPVVVVWLTNDAQQWAASYAITLFTEYELCRSLWNLGQCYPSYWVFHA